MVATLADGTNLDVICQTEGDFVYIPRTNQVSFVWDDVAFQDGSGIAQGGYVSDVCVTRRLPRANSQQQRRQHPPATISTIPASPAAPDVAGQRTGVIGIGATIWRVSDRGG